MPFDGPITDYAPVVVPTVAPFDFGTATPDERLLELARMLEDEQAWRDTRMEWNFSSIRLQSNICGTAGCAVGLAQIVWPKFLFNDHGNDRSEIVFGLDLDNEWGQLFGNGLAMSLGLTLAAVTPGHVATAIRQFVATRQGA